ncbi:hypothetical protein HZH66_014292 [Vespula vulgaris]|uniref:Uncharacterized protein n=1 Tax=Vespula vulgaris TaxID=7454 RepID=A0A834J2K1_VESVU|nr:hypothetical protein HZH66_014292 [Vespula vulgaris]
MENTTVFEWNMEFQKLFEKLQRGLTSKVVVYPLSSYPEVPRESESAPGTIGEESGNACILMGQSNPDRFQADSGKGRRMENVKRKEVSTVNVKTEEKERKKASLCFERMPD